MKGFIQMHQMLAFGIGIAALYVSGAFVALMWAIKNGQFSDQDHARYLPLEAREIGEEVKDGGQQSENRPRSAESCGS